MFDNLGLDLSVWWRWYDSTSIHLLCFAVAFVTMILRMLFKQKGFGWIAFLPAVVPAVPTAIILYDMVQYSILHGTCLPEDGCMDEASGFVFLGVLRTVFVFFLCLGFELLVEDARKRKANRSTIPASEGTIAYDEKPRGWFRGILQPALGLVVFGTFGGIIAYLIQSSLIRTVSAMTTELFGFVVPESAMYIGTCGLAGLIVCLIQRSLAAVFLKASALAGFLLIVVYTGRVMLMEYPGSIYLLFLVLVAGGTAYLLSRFKKPWLFYGAPILSFVAGFILGRIL